MVLQESEVFKVYQVPQDQMVLQDLVVLQDPREFQEPLRVLS